MNAPAKKRGRPLKPRPPKTPTPKADSGREGGKKAGTGRGIYSPEFAGIARTMCRLGALNKDLADAFGVSERSIEKWMAAHAEFAEACTIGKGHADDMVEQALFRRAIGYEHPATKFFNHNGVVVTADYTERYPPDTAACFIWLKNRRKKQWRDKQEIEITDATPTGELLRKARERRKRLEQEASDAG